MNAEKRGEEASLYSFFSLPRWKNTINWQELLYPHTHLYTHKKSIQSLKGKKYINQIEYFAGARFSYHFSSIAMGKNIKNILFVRISQRGMNFYIFEKSFCVLYFGKYFLRDLTLESVREKKKTLKIIPIKSIEFPSPRLNKTTTNKYSMRDELNVNPDVWRLLISSPQTSFKLSIIYQMAEWRCIANVLRNGENPFSTLPLSLFLQNR